MPSGQTLKNLIFGGRPGLQRGTTVSPSVLHPAAVAAAQLPDSGVASAASQVVAAAPLRTPTDHLFPATSPWLSVVYWYAHDQCVSLHHMLTLAKLPDIFNKGFGFGLVKLEVKRKSCGGVGFSTSGSSNADTGKVSGTLETKYKWYEYGLTFTEKWNTDNTLGTGIAVEDQICQGLKLTFDTTSSPNTGKKSGKYQVCLQEGMYKPWL